MADTTDQQISDAAALPAKYELDGERIEARPIGDLIKAATFIAKKRVAANPFRAIRGCVISTEGPER